MKEKCKTEGMNVAEVSTVGPKLMRSSANRHKIDSPLLADQESSLIRSFKVFNAEAHGMEQGMAYPGFFYIDSEGVIRDTYFEVRYTDRFTPNNVIGKLFPELTEEVRQNVEAPHLRLTLAQSD